MRIVTWNVNSLKARSEFVELFLDDVQPDIVCLQELKLEESHVPTTMFTDRGYELAIHGQKSWNGVLIASKFPIESVERGLPDADEGQARSIAATIAGFRLINLYCPQGQSAESPKFAYKLRFFDALIEWLDNGAGQTDPLIVVGDLNIAPEERDVWAPARLAGVPSFHPLEHQRWASLLELGLHDVVKDRIAPGTYSFWDYRGGAFRFNQGMRIDHVLVTSPLLDRVESVSIEREWRKKKEGLTASDHAPVILDLRVE